MPFSQMFDELQIVELKYKMTKIKVLNVIKNNDKCLLQLINILL